MVKGFKLTKAWKRDRRAHDKLKKPNLSDCPRCRQPKKPHVICGNCGHYKEKKIVDMSNI